MNYLAHAYFSFGHPQILTGNMISDHVKGRKQYDYPEQIQQGIRLHRAIDAFTDEHPVTKELKKIFAPAVRLYAGAFADVVYDHFLALNETELKEPEWMDFTQTTYGQLNQQQAHFPEHFARMFPYMQQQNWLFNYRYTWGIENSFGGLTRRARYLNSSEEAFRLFTENYADAAVLSNEFIADAKKFATDQFQSLIRQ